MKLLNKITRAPVYMGVCTFLWFLIFMGLPLTSFPLLSRLSGAIVAPFSAIPLAVLGLIWFLPFILNRGKFPDEILPMLYFVLVAVAVTAIGYFLNGFYLKGRDFFDQNLRAFITLMIGLTFYLIFSAYPSTEKRIQQALIFITISGVMVLIFTLIEIILLRKYERVIYLPGWFLQLRTWLAVQSPNVLYTNRVSGFAYEPSWFVRQFNLIFFPIWFSAAFQRKSLFKFRLWRFQIEDFLLLPALVAFIFSAPRVGLLAFLMLIGYLGWLVFQKLHHWLVRRVLQKRKKPIHHENGIRLILGLLLAIVLFVVAVGLLVGFVVFAARWDDRYLLFFTGQPFFTEGNFFPITENTLLDLGRRLAFYERLIYWFSGWRIFNDYPLGVGLGNAGFYFIDRMNGVAYNSLEMRDVVFRAGSLPNVKNIWIRLLAETGLPGFILFVVWGMLLWRSSELLRRQTSSVFKILGLAGQLCLAAYLMEGLSMDSFAMPYLWVMMGLVSAGAFLVRQKNLVRDRASQLDRPVQTV